mmetsp:Transcript_3480/g.9269  ORF Transcript_3480/g.9269 Transcript_3480/m.9269 type:complete len:242 (+) Transcript_3480:1633-2358(+)
MVGEVLAVLLRLSPKPFVLLYGGGDGEDDDGSLLASDELSWSGEWGLEKGRSSREMGHLMRAHRSLPSTPAKASSSSPSSLPPGTSGPFLNAKYTRPHLSPNTLSATEVTQLSTERSPVSLLPLWACPAAVLPLRDVDLMWASGCSSEMRSEVRGSITASRFWRCCSSHRPWKSRRRLGGRHSTALGGRPSMIRDNLSSSSSTKYRYRGALPLPDPSMHSSSCTCPVVRASSSLARNETTS